MVYLGWGSKYRELCYIVRYQNYDVRDNIFTNPDFTGKNINNSIFYNIYMITFQFFIIASPGDGDVVFAAIALLQSDAVIVTAKDDARFFEALRRTETQEAMDAELNPSQRGYSYDYFRNLANSVLPSSRNVFHEADVYKRNPHYAYKDVFHFSYTDILDIKITDTNIDTIPNGDFYSNTLREKGYDVCMNVLVRDRPQSNSNNNNNKAKMRVELVQIFMSNKNSSYIHISPEHINGAPDANTARTDGGTALAAKLFQSFVGSSVAKSAQIPIYAMEFGENDDRRQRLCADYYASCVKDARALLAKENNDFEDEFGVKMSISSDRDRKG